MNNDKLFNLFILLTMITLSAMSLCIFAVSSVMFYASIKPTTNVSIVYNIEQPKVEVKSEVPKKVAVAPKKKEEAISNDVYLLAQIIHAEAKGEPYNGKLAVGNVVLNRVNSMQFPNSIEKVIFQRGQFSPVMDGSIYNKPSSESLKAAQEVLSGKRIFGDEVLFFYNPKVSTSGWIFTRETVLEIGNHRFAK